VSRSYKKKSRVKDHNKGMKTIAARRFRRNNIDEDIPDHMGYKKTFDQYSISDWNYGQSFESYLKSHCKIYGLTELTDKTIAHVRDEWERTFKRK
jgi:hypothetical protein